MTEIRFRLKPVAPFRLDFTVWALRRRPHNIVDRFDGQSYRRVLVLGGKSAEIAVGQVAPRDAPEIEVSAAGPGASHQARPAIEAAVKRILGLEINLEAFYAMAGKDRALGPMAERLYGMKPVRFPCNFEAVANAVSCQQVSLTAGLHLVNRMARAYGRRCAANRAERVYAFADPRKIARATADDLRALGFSRSKARYLIGLAGSASDAGAPDFRAIETLDDGAAASALRRLTGVGRWTAEYVMLRGFGRFNVFPGDDVGGRNRLCEWLGIRRTLDYDGVRGVVEQWNPWGGLVYFHLLVSALAERGIVN